METERPIPPIPDSLREQLDRFAASGRIPLRPATDILTNGPAAKSPRYWWVKD